MQKSMADFQKQFHGLVHVRIIDHPIMEEDQIHIAFEWT
jgi:hypothetical protein